MKTNNIINHIEKIRAKNNKNWIIIDKYSINSQESEILLKQNSIFFIEKIDYKVVNIDGKKKEYKIITLEICNDVDFFENKLLIKKIYKIKILY